VAHHLFFTDARAAAASSHGNGTNRPGELCMSACSELSLFKSRLASGGFRKLAPLLIEKTS
jgi:hypothetical protein